MKWYSPDMTWLDKISLIFLTVSNAEDCIKFNLIWFHEFHLQNQLKRENWGRIRWWGRYGRRRQRRGGSSWRWLELYLPPVIDDQWENVWGPSKNMDSFQVVHEVLMDVVSALSWIVCLGRWQGSPWESVLARVLTSSWCWVYVNIGSRGVNPEIRGLQTHH